MSSMTRIVFCPDCRRTSTTTARSPLRNADVRASSSVSTTSATSATRIGAPLVDAAAGDLHVVCRDSLPDLAGTESVCGKFLDIDLDVQLTRPAARHSHFADAVDRLQRTPDPLIGDLGQGPQPLRAAQR